METIIKRLLEIKDKCKEDSPYIKVLGKDGKERVITNRKRVIKLIKAKLPIPRTKLSKQSPPYLVIKFIGEDSLAVVNIYLRGFVSIEGEVTKGEVENIIRYLYSRERSINNLLALTENKELTYKDSKASIKRSS